MFQTGLKTGNLDLERHRQIGLETFVKNCKKFCMIPYECNNF